MRKIISHLLATIISVGCFNSCAAQSAVASFSMFRGDKKHTGIYPSEPISITPGLKLRPVDVGLALGCIPQHR